MFWQHGLCCKNAYVSWLLPYLTLKQLLIEIWEATSQIWHPQKVCQIKHSSQLLLGASVDTILDLYPASLPAEFPSGLSTEGTASASGFMARTPFVYWNDRRHFLSKVSVSVQSLSHVRLFATPWTAALQASLSITNSQSLFKLLSIESMMPSNHLILCRPLLLPPSVFPSIRVFSNESVLHSKWPKYWSFSFSISSSNEYLGLISFRMDWLDLLAV